MSIQRAQREKSRTRMGEKGLEVRCERRQAVDERWRQPDSEEWRGDVAEGRSAAAACKGVGTSSYSSYSETYYSLFDDYFYNFTSKCTRYLTVPMAMMSCKVIFHIGHPDKSHVTRV